MEQDLNWLTGSRLSDSQEDELADHLLSANSALRQAVLRILSRSAPEGGKTGDVWSACLLVEASGMTLKNVRERTSNIGKLGRLLVSQSDDTTERIVQKAMRYLVAQLKVNFRPLYSETVTVLASLADRKGETLWDIVWDQLQQTISATEIHMADLDWIEPTWSRVRASLREDDGVLDEEDIEFRCTSLNKSRRVLDTAWAKGESRDISDEAEIGVSNSSPVDVIRLRSLIDRSLRSRPTA